MRGDKMSDLLERVNEILLNVDKKLNTVAEEFSDSLNKGIGAFDTEVNSAVGKIGNEIDVFCEKNLEGVNNFCKGFEDKDNTINNVDYEKNKEEYDTSELNNDINLNKSSGIHLEK